MNRLLKAIGGVVLIGLGIWLVVIWRYDVLTLIKGGVPLLALMVGAVVLALVKE